MQEITGFMTPNGQVVDEVRGIIPFENGLDENTQLGPLLQEEIDERAERIRYLLQRRKRHNDAVGRNVDIVVRRIEIELAALNVPAVQSAHVLDDFAGRRRPIEAGYLLARKHLRQNAYVPAGPASEFIDMVAIRK